MILSTRAKHLMRSRILIPAVLCGLCGCSDSQPPVQSRAGTVTAVPKLPKDKFVRSRLGYTGCFVELKDGSCLSLCRVERAGQQENQYELLISHMIELDKQRSYAPVDPKQQPLKSLSLALYSDSPLQSNWIPFPSPHEDGEMSLLAFKYNVIVNTNSPDSPIELRVESKDETYTVAGPPISSFMRLRWNPNSQRRELVRE